MKTLPRTGLDKGCLHFEEGDIEIRYAAFIGQTSLREYHLMLQAPSEGKFEAQLAVLSAAYSYALDRLELSPDSAVLRRFFCSDPANQQSILEAHPLADVEAPCAVSIIGQPPLPRGKIALWAYHVSSPGGSLLKKRTGATIELQRGELTHYWTCQATRPERPDSYAQTEGIFEDYIGFLQQRNMRLDLNVVRTWLYARDVDSTYQGLVDARRELFIKEGLTPQTHYIASTGIEGRTAEARVKVSMDAYSVAGLRPEQLRFLEAPNHLGPTIAYGVSFERATAAHYRDRQHIYISGTASIDPSGVILHVGNVMAQLERVLQNIEALLADAAADLNDVASFIVYLRDPDDAERVQTQLNRRFPETPIVTVWAPVCRPGWLVEIEAIAIAASANPELPEY